MGHVALSAVVVASALTIFSESAEARRRSGAPAYSPPYASIVVDVKTGKVLQATNPDAARHPASITKVMTLYMLFEQLERGRYSLQSELRISGHAARQAPSKIGLQPGETISVEDAIKAVVTKSANDIAAAIGENIAGSEERFAELMTQRARSIGMKSTTFVNASGLPDPEQITTARDLALLGRAIQDRFPKYYHFFGTRVFNYDGASYRNHNKLLGRVEGVDGIKTGYTRASGFNLLTSAKDDGRQVIAVVLGGRSGRARDAQVASLVEEHLPRAFAGARQAPRVVDVAA
ncbi:MAG TPA: D-alanyl-D-alanine carboxypeptidase family protein, partial [Accumulibacter sp.]|nr:D-alanyl-D-alanine carboxypeptidase family protein [Accumulibacter sp.]